MTPASEVVRLKRGSEMPVLGLGTWQLTGKEARSGVEHALEIGYRLIDTSSDYGNEAEIREALRALPLDRDDVFLTSKVEEDEDAYEATRSRARALGVEQLDLCLLHRPPPEGAGEELWEGLIRARADGLAREIGVSNYTPAQIDQLTDATDEVPAVNQIEWSPFGCSREVLEHARRNGIVVQAYSPLTRGKRLDEEVLREIGDQHGKSPAQVVLRWNLQVGTPPVPKAASPAHRAENIEIFDFQLDDEEMTRLTGLNEHYSALAGLPYI